MLLILIYDLWLTCRKPSLDLITEGGGHFSRMRLEICLLFCAILFSCWVSILLPVQACLRGGITAPSLKCWPILEFTQESQLHNPDFGGNFPLVVFGLTHSKNADSWFTTSLWKKKMPLFKNRRDCWVVLWKMSAMTDESDPHYQPTVRIFANVMRILLKCFCQCLFVIIKFIKLKGTFSCQVKTLLVKWILTNLNFSADKATSILI